MLGASPPGLMPDLEPLGPPDLRASLGAWPVPAAQPVRAARARADDGAWAGPHLPSKPAPGGGAARECTGARGGLDIR